MVLKKKIYWLFLAILLVTGCSSKYQLEVTNDKFIEQVDTEILNKDIPDYNFKASNSDFATPFIKDDTFVTPFPDNTNIHYNKKVTETKDGYNVKLSYTYKPDEFRNSYAMSMCFENHNFQNEKKYFNFHLSGRFYCLYSDNLTITVKTDNYVSEHNADKVEGNTYIWYIDNSNLNTTDINIKISKQDKKNYIFRNAVLIIIGVVLIGSAIYITYKKIKRN